MGKSGKDNTLPDPNADICHFKKMQTIFKRYG